MVKIDFTNQETYQLIKLYDLLRDTDMLDDWGDLLDIHTLLEETKIKFEQKLAKAQAKQPTMEW